MKSRAPLLACPKRTSPGPRASTHAPQRLHSPAKLIIIVALVFVENFDLQRLAHWLHYARLYATHANIDKETKSYSKRLCSTWLKL